MTQKSRKIRAIAAGGAVLGVGAAITLAAWSDSEFATGLFNSGTFGIEAAAGDGAFDDHATQDDVLDLAFEVDRMVPGETFTAPYQIRNIVGGEDSVVTFTKETIGEELVSDLTAQILMIDGTDCDLDTEGKVLAEGGSFNLESLDPENPDPQNLCIKVTLDNDTPEDPTLQGGTSAIVWEFKAELPKEEQA